MRTSRAIIPALAALLTGAGPGFALDPPARAQARLPAAGYTSASDAMRSAVRELNAGDMVGALQALEFAAKQGHPLAQWKLGRMYASGDGVPADDLKAFEYFSKIAQDHADEAPDSPHGAVVANAFVALGTYFLEGIKGTYVKRDMGRAHDTFHYAASYFGNPDAQYSLARLYLDGKGVAPDARQAARWLNLAAEKGHAPAQALLGHLLMNGHPGIPRQRPLGLMWLTLAREAAASGKERWISELYEKGAEIASESDRQRALSYVEQYQKKKR
jgi:TPR repeat protein